MNAFVNQVGLGARWIEDGHRVALATLVETLGSAPFEPGAEMFISDELQVEGSVTGGCVEAALVEEARELFATDRPRLVTYGISDDEAANVGLVCGGTVRLFVHELQHAAREAVEGVAAAVERGEPVALATLLSGPEAGSKLVVFEDRSVGSLQATALLDETVIREGRGFLDEGTSALRRYGAGGQAMGSDLAVFIHALAAPPRMVIFGAIDFSAAIGRIAREVGYRVIICDARARFAESNRFSETADVVIDWPDRYLEGVDLGPRDAVLIFTHDPKFDEPALASGLASGAGYIGALGSRRTHARRVERLRQAGLPEAEIARIHAPCGLDVGARTPAETAVSVLAEVIAAGTGRSGASLRETSGPIHAERVEQAALVRPLTGRSPA